MYKKEEREKLNAGKDLECGENAVFFIQYACVIDYAPKEKSSLNNTNKAKRQVYGLVVSSVAVFIFFFTIITFDYIKSIQDNKYIDYDVKTITAGDYTVQFDITCKLFDNWKKNYFDEHNPMSEMGQFKQYIWNQMETQINLMKHQDYAKLDDNGDFKCKIAQITFAFHNEWLIEKLTDRG